MVESSVLDRYACASPPRHLWRVSYPSAITRRDQVTGDIVARDQVTQFSNKADLKEAFAAHIDWNCRKLSCFVSVLSETDHTFKWASWRTRTRNETVCIYQIDTSELPKNVYIFDATSMAKEFGIKHEYGDHEFLFLHRIPAAAISQPMDLEAFNKHRHSLFWRTLDGMNQAHLAAAETTDPHETWSGDEASEEHDGVDALADQFSEKLVVNDVGTSFVKFDSSSRECFSMPAELRVPLGINIASNL